MRTFRIGLLLLGGMLTAGCATVGVPSGNETVVAPAHRLAGFRAQGEAYVSFVRVGRFGGAACDVRLYVDAQPVADVAAGRAIVFGVSAGEVTIRAHYAERGMCPSQVSVLKLQMRRGQRQDVVYDISPNSGQHVLQAL